MAARTRAGALEPTNTHVNWRFIGSKRTMIERTAFLRPFDTCIFILAVIYHRN